MNADMHSVDSIALAMGNVIVQATLIATVALAATYVFRRNAAARNRIQTSALVLLLAVPGIVLVAQASGGGMLIVMSPPLSTAASSENSTARMASSPAPRNRASTKLTDAALNESLDGESPQRANVQSANDLEGPTNSDKDTGPNNHSKTSSALDNTSDKPLSTAAVPSPVEETAGTNSLATLQLVALFALSAWAVGAVVLLVRLIRGWARLAAMLRRATLFPAKSQPLEIASVLDDVCNDLGTRRRVQLLVSAEIGSPLVAGIWTPRIVLPANLAGNVERSQLRQILLHEMAHVIRRDPLVAMLQNIVGVIYWFHPLVAILLRLIRHSREEVCDNYVLSVVDPPSYGRTLLEVAEWMGNHQTYPATVALLDDSGYRKTGQLEARISRILDDRRNVAARISRVAAVCLIALTSALGLVAALATLGLAESEPPHHQANHHQGDAQTPAVDLYGDEIPYGATARLGTTRFRRNGDSWQSNLAFTKNSQQLVWLTESGISLVWDVKTGQSQPSSIYTTEGVSNVSAGEVSLDGSRLASVIVERQADGSRRARLQIVDTESLQVLATTDNISQSDGTWGDVSLSHDNNFVALGSERGRLMVLDAKTLRSIIDIPLSDQPVQLHDIALSPDGQTLVVATQRELYAWDWNKSGSPKQMPSLSRMGFVGYLPDGRLLVGSEGESYGTYQIDIWDADRQAVQRQFETPEEGCHLIGKTTISRDGRYLISAIDVDEGTPRWTNYIFVWDVETGKIVHRFHGGQPAFSGVAISPDQKRIASSANYMIAVWDLETGAAVGKIEDAHTDHVDRVKFTPDSKHVVTAAMDGTCRVWDAATGEQQFVLTHEHWVRGMDVSSDGKWIATSALNDTVCLWNRATGEKVYHWQGNGRHGGRREVGFSDDSQRVISWADDTPYLRVWDVQTGRLLTEAKIGPQPGGFPPPDEHCIIAPSGLLVARFRTGVELLDSSTGEVVSRINNTESPFEDGWFSPDSNRILLTHYHPTEENPRRRASFEGQYEYVMHDLDDNSTVWNFIVDGRRGQLIYSPTGQIVAVTAWQADVEIIHFLNAKTGETLGEVTINGRLGYINPGRMAFSPDGKLFSAALMDTTALVWKLADLGIEVE